MGTMSRKLGGETVRQMVRTIRPEWAVQEMALIESGTDTVYYVTAETDNGVSECVLKACTAVPEADFRPEPYICHLLNQRTSIPVPQIIGVVDNHEHLPSPFYLMERCEGTLADSIEFTPDIITQIARDAGRYAGEYHTMGEFQRFGRLRLDCDMTHSRTGITIEGRTLAAADDAESSWHAWIEALYRDWLDDLDERFVDLRPKIEAFIDARLDTLDQSFSAVLGHIDYKFWNILVRPETGETTAVLDWGHATTMDPFYDLIVTEHHLSRWAPLQSPWRQRVRTALKDGCSQTNELNLGPAFDERRELYLLVSYLQPLVWFSEWMANASETDRRETAENHRQFVSDLLA